MRPATKAEAIRTGNRQARDRRIGPPFVVKELPGAYPGYWPPSCCCEDAVVSERELPPDPDLDDLPRELAEREGPLVISGVDDDGTHYAAL